jgi:predicted membrane channel-forming protein YqfA (hemolysin III family)
MNAAMTTTTVTWLGIAQAAGMAIFAYYTTENADGSIDWTDPMFYIGMGVAALMAVKAYMTQGTPAPGTVMATKIDPGPQKDSATV